MKYKQNKKNISLIHGIMYKTIVELKNKEHKWDIK